MPTDSMSIDDAKSLVSFMRLSGVSSFKFKDLEVAFEEPVRVSGEVFADQKRLAEVFSWGEDEPEPKDPTEDLDGSASYTDADLFGSA
jgi:hypothetical protein